MSLVIYSNGILAADMYCANIEEAGGPGTNVLKEKIFNTGNKTLAFGCVGLSTTVETALVLGKIMEDDLLHNLESNRPEFISRHRPWFRETFGIDSASFLVMTKKNLYLFDGSVWTRQEDAPAALGTGAFQALVFTRNGLSANEAVTRTSESNFTVSREHTYIKRSQLKDLKK